MFRFGCYLMLCRCLVWVEVLLLDRPCMVFQKSAWCACHPSLHLSVRSICFMSEFISSFKILRDGSQVFALFMLSLCVILHTMWSAKSLLLLCILTFGILCLSAISMTFKKIMLAVCMLDMVV